MKMKKNYVYYGILVILGLLLSGCLTSKTNITTNKNNISNNNVIINIEFEEANKADIQILDEKYMVLKTIESTSEISKKTALVISEKDLLSTYKYIKIIPYSKYNAVIKPIVIGNMQFYINNLNEASYKIEKVVNWKSNVIIEIRPKSTGEVFPFISKTELKHIINKNNEANIYFIKDFINEKNQIVIYEVGTLNSNVYNIEIFDSSAGKIYGYRDTESQEVYFYFKDIKKFEIEKELI